MHRATVLCPLQSCNHNVRSCRGGRHVKESWRIAQCGNGKQRVRYGDGDANVSRHSRLGARSDDFAGDVVGAQRRRAFIVPAPTAGSSPRSCTIPPPSITINVRILCTVMPLGHDFFDPSIAPFQRIQPCGETDILSVVPAVCLVDLVSCLTADVSAWFLPRGGNSTLSLALLSHPPGPNGAPMVWLSRAYSGSTFREGTQLYPNLVASLFLVAAWSRPLPTLPVKVRLYACQSSSYGESDGLPTPSIMIIAWNAVQKAKPYALS